MRSSCWPADTVSAAACANGEWLGAPCLRLERLGDLARVHIDVPAGSGDAGAAVRRGLRYAVRWAESDPALSGMLITSVDAPMLAGTHRAPKVSTRFRSSEPQDAVDGLPLAALRESSKPVVCAVGGACQDDGLLVALSSSAAVASDRATFWVPDLLGGTLDPRDAQVLGHLLGPAWTRDLMPTERVLGAEEALSWGLVSRVVPHEKLLATASEVLGLLAGRGRGALMRLAGSGAE